MAEPRQKRRQILVNRKFQLGVTLRIVGPVYVWLVFFAFLANFSALWVLVFGGSTEAYIGAVDRLRVFSEVFVLPLVLSFACICIHGMWVAHRLAGPLQRLRNVLQGIRQRKLPATFTIRDRDYFHELSDDVHQLLVHLREEIGSFHEVSAELAREGEELLRSGNLCDEDRERLLHIANNSSRLRQMVDGYSVADTPAPAADRVPAAV